MPTFSTLRARSYVFRLPLFTRAMALIIVLLWAFGVQSVWDLRAWGALIPDKISFATGEPVNPALTTLESQHCADLAFLRLPSVDISPNPSQLHTHCAQCRCFDTADGEVRKRAWNLDDSRTILRA